MSAVIQVDRSIKVGSQLIFCNYLFAVLSSILFGYINFRLKRIFFSWRFLFEVARCRSQLLWIILKCPHIEQWSSYYQFTDCIFSLGLGLYVCYVGHRRFGSKSVFPQRDCLQTKFKIKPVLRLFKYTDISQKKLLFMIMTVETHRTMTYRARQNKWSLII